MDSVFKQYLTLKHNSYRTDLVLADDRPPGEKDYYNYFNYLWTSMLVTSGLITVFVLVTAPWLLASL